MKWKVKGQRPEDKFQAEELYGKAGAGVYEKNAMRHIQEQILSRAVALLQLQGSERVLDAGCGTGFGMQLLQRAGFSVEGFDLSDEMLALARKKGLAVKKGDLRDIPFKQKEFDAVVSVSALQWVPFHQRKIVAREFWRVLKAGGKAAVQFYPASEQEMTRTGSLFKRQGFSGRIQIDGEDNPRKRKVYLILQKEADGAPAETG
jgi:ubiquinone/menaquinone biosynthesis C-methylase UbiE